MTFKPNRRVSLFFDDGTEVSVRPFFSFCRNPRSLICELYTETGEPVRCLDEEAGLYAIGDAERPLRLQPPA